MDKVLEAMSAYAMALSYNDISKDVVHQVKRKVIDTLGCAVGAYQAEPARMAQEYALQVRARPGATLLGTGHLTCPDLAAYANGVLARYLDYNDTGLSLEPGHPSDNIPAVLAAAEYASADVKTLITGIVLAYEIQGRLGEVSFRERGWDGVSYLAISSAAGAGKVLGLDRGQMANALSIAATANIATRQTRTGTLSMWKGCAAAHAARNGVFASLMAGRGLTGPGEAFEGPMGFARWVWGGVRAPDFTQKSQAFKLEQTKFKFFPADYEAQCAANPAVELHGDLHGRIEDIEKVVINAYAHAVDVAADSPDKWSPRTRETADHSLPYVVAVALARGTVCLADFEEESVNDPRLHALMRKIEVHKDPEYSKAWPEANSVRIDVFTRDGRKHTRECRYAKGHPRNPMTEQEIEAKFIRLCQPYLSPRRIHRILDRLWHLEGVKDLKELVSLFKMPNQAKRGVAAC